MFVIPKKTQMILLIIYSFRFNNCNFRVFNNIADDVCRSIAIIMIIIMITIMIIMITEEYLLLNSASHLTIPNNNNNHNNNENYFNENNLQFDE